jgi:hypothetical protein
MHHFGILAACITLLGTGTASAQFWAPEDIDETFEGYAIGSVIGQDGWTGDAIYPPQVVAYGLLGDKKV